MDKSDLQTMINYLRKKYQQNSYTPEERAQLREALTFTKGGRMPPDLSTPPPMSDPKALTRWINAVKVHLATWDPVFRDFLGPIPRLSAADRDRLDHQKAKEMVDYREKFRRMP